ncbi:MAG: class I SAM-dependent RNA methyltransferase [Chloroflexi bacterium]|nr:class I SAM-dependent RNA methyltransferase [Chloroflexota bacterium]NOG35944.1 class I SAM-dependent RNA methyltransferase [Chloroflexota bacterium]GIK56217.1 MAG: 23S rRNA (uracil-5-)-methyltransferase RumA [Chloroflexota bacterium]
METITLDVTEFANGGYAVGRASRGRTVFVPYALPGEKVKAAIHTEKNKVAYAHLQQVLKASSERVEPRCPHFGVCGGCHFQHMSYEAQLRGKQAVVVDQMLRIGNVKDAPVRATLPHPQPWDYGMEMSLSPIAGGGVGFWSPAEKQIIPIESCPITRPELVDLLHDVDLELPGLRKLTLRVGDDEALLAAVEVDGVEPPDLEADFPLSVVIVLPDDTAVNLIGDNFTIQAIKGRDFRISAGCYLPPSAAGMELVVETVRRYAGLTGVEQVLELYSGVGMLTAFLAQGVAAVVAIEMNPDAVADTAVNVDADHVSLYEGTVEEVLPELDIKPDVLVLHPPAEGLSREAAKAVAGLRPSRIVYVSSDIATLARDGRAFGRDGYNLVEVQPIDTRPQTFHMDVVGVWEK